jgi:YfiH family protein
MLEKKKGRLTWLEFEQLAEFPELQHGVFLKNAPKEEIRALWESHDWVGGHQVHSATVKQLPIAPEEKCDGLFTNEAGKALLIKHADCQAAIFYDPETKTVANVHCGWRGNVQNIYRETIQQMAQAGCSPQSLRVCISPSLGPCCAEFIHYQTELPKGFWKYQVKPNYFDLWEIARMQLIEAGVLPHHIEIAQICTCCNPNEYHSYRRDKTAHRHLTVVSLS